MRLIFARRADENRKKLVTHPVAGQAWYSSLVLEAGLSVVGQGPGHRPDNIGDDERSPILRVPRQDRELTVSSDRIGNPVGIEKLYAACVLARTWHRLLLVFFQCFGLSLALPPK